MKDSVPGAALLRPLVLGSLLVLVLNDHVLKRTLPGFISGKLSDFAGVLLLPVFLHALFEVLFRGLTGRTLASRRANAVLVTCVSLSALVFALPEVWAPAEAAYRYGVALLLWPFDAISSLLTRGRWPPLQRPRATADVTDLAALPMAFVAYRTARRSEPNAPAPRRAPGAVGSVLLLALLWSAPARAMEKPNAYRHDGFYMTLGGAVGGTLLDSQASISNGFRQRLASSARGPSIGASFELGGTLFASGLVLGVGLAHTVLRGPQFRARGETFTLSRHDFVLTQLEIVAHYYPDPRAGLQFGAALGVLMIAQETASSGDGWEQTVDQQNGVVSALEGGYGAFIARQWTLAGNLRLSAGRVTGEHGATWLFAPSIVARIVWH